ncbi:hypothetical protein GQ600_16399 [Phytophthora cactorum]|nr:hypothetical protein GQ600_16399 [Phytophthora cactorum]
MLRNSKTFDAIRVERIIAYITVEFSRNQVEQPCACLLAIHLPCWVQCLFLVLLERETVRRPDHINTEPLSGPRFFTGNKNSALSKRGLRSYDGPKKNKNNIDDKIKEERAGIPGLSMLDDLGYKLALDRKMNPADIFRVLVLENRAREFLFSDDKLFDLLWDTTKSEAYLVTLFQSLRQYPTVKKLGDKMQP